MLLYHGTSARSLTGILTHGIKPRGKKSGNWADTVRSNASAVYLTNAYPIHFATASAKGSEPLVVFEVDTDKLDLSMMAPDEDCLEQGTRKDPDFTHVPGTNPFDMKKRTMWFRKRALSEFGQYWELSLTSLGTCCYYGTIPVDAITAYCKWSVSANLTFASDPTITLINYAIKGTFYRQLTRRMFGHEFDEETPFDHERRMLENPDLLKEVFLVQQK